jgi:hypothetical protein
MNAKAAAASEDRTKLDRTLHQKHFAPIHNLSCTVFGMTRARGLLFLVLIVRLTEATSTQAADLSACRNIVALQDSTSMSNRKRHNR